IEPWTPSPTTNLVYLAGCGCLRLCLVTQSAAIRKLMGGNHKMQANPAHCSLARKGHCLPSTLPPEVITKFAERTGYHRVTAEEAPTKDATNTLGLAINSP